MRVFSVLAMTATVMLGQAPTEFEVVSIKVHPEPITMSSNMTRGSGYRGVAIKLLDLIEDAYSVIETRFQEGRPGPPQSILTLTPKLPAPRS
jgi:hypothetical protein